MIIIDTYWSPPEQQFTINPINSFKHYLNENVRITASSLKQFKVKNKNKLKDVNRHLFVSETWFCFYIQFDEVKKKMFFFLPLSVGGHLSTSRSAHFHDSLILSLCVLPTHTPTHTTLISISPTSSSLLFLSPTLCIS